MDDDNSAPGKCTTKAMRIARVKFVALPADALPGRTSPRTLTGHILQLLFRAIGRPEAARP